MEIERLKRRERENVGLDLKAVMKSVPKVEVTLIG